MKIGQGEKYDVSSTSTEGITAEELAEIDKKKTKLIDIYKKFDVNNDGKLDKIELAMAMDGFTSVGGDDNKLSGKELDELAATFNETHGLDGKKAIKGKDMKDFLKSVRNFTKDDAKESTAGIILDDMLATDAKNQGYAEVDTNGGIYQKDGKYYQQSHGDGMINYTRVRQGDNGFVAMTSAEINAEVEAEKLATINTKAQKDGFTVSEDGTYIKDNQVYVYDESNSQFVRAKQSEDGFVPMTKEDLAKEQADIAAEQRRQELAIQTDYTVQNGENFRTLIKQSLEAQGIEVTDETMNKAIEEFKENNPGKLHGRAGREYLYAGDVVKIAGGLEDKANADIVKNAYRASIQSKEQAKAKAKSNSNTKSASVSTSTNSKKTSNTASATNSASVKKQNNSSKAYSVKGADPNTGKLNNKNYTNIKGVGLCKYDQNQKGYVAFTGTYDNKPYKNGKIDTVQISKNLQQKYPLIERLSNGYTRREAPGWNDVYFDQNGMRISEKVYKKAGGQSLTGGLLSPISEKLDNGYYKRSTGAPQFRNYYYNNKGTEISQTEYTNAAKKHKTVDIY